MNENDDLIFPKEWWKSKAIMSGLAGALLALYTALAQVYGWDDRWVPPVAGFLASVAVIGLRLAKKPIGDPATDEVLPPADLIQPRGEEEQV